MKVDVGAAIGVTRQHKVLLLLEYVAMELHNQAFATLGAAEQQAVREDAEEHFISYAFLRQIGAQHGNLKVDLQNDFTIGENRYPKNRQQTLHLLEPSPRERCLFKRAVEGTEPRKEKENLSIRNIGRTRNATSARRRRDIQHRTARRQMPTKTTSKSSSSQARSVKKLAKEFKSTMKKAFTQLQEMKEADSDISDSEASEGDSHFQLEVSGFQFAQVEKEFEPQIAKLFKQAWTKQKV
jgi:hypothetical protein